MQFDLSRFTQTDPAVPGRLTSLQFAPSALYSLTDRVNDYFWLRPYVGAGLSIYRQSFSDPALPGLSVSDSTTGYQAFGGAEVTFPSMPRFAVSADIGYRWARDTAFAGFDLGGVGFTLAGHWYVR